MDATIKGTAFPVSCLRALRLFCWIGRNGIGLSPISDAFQRRGEILERFRTGESYGIGCGTAQSQMGIRKMAKGRIESNVKMHPHTKY
jgi:hypothetical protein